MILKTMDGVVIPIGSDEANKIAVAISKGNKHVLVRGALLPSSSIAIYPDEYWAEREKHGRLHDGTVVIRQFGNWVDARNPEVRLSWDHYPELARDEVLTEAEYIRVGLNKPELESEERKQIYQSAVAKRAQNALEGTVAKQIE